MARSPFLAKFAWEEIIVVFLNYLAWIRGFGNLFSHRRTGPRVEQPHAKSDKPGE
jgi:hypothetical protein